MKLAVLVALCAFSLCMLIYTFASCQHCPVNTFHGVHCIAVGSMLGFGLLSPVEQTRLSRGGGDCYPARMRWSGSWCCLELGTPAAPNYGILAQGRQKGINHTCHIRSLKHKFAGIIQVTLVRCKVFLLPYK